MSRITRVHAREILDSRGNPTVEAEVFLQSGASGRAAVPSGASTGEREALELRDGDRARYLGKGVRKAVENIRLKIAPQIVGLSAADQSKIDQALIALDATPNKRALGANALLGVSLAAAKAAAADANIPLYRHIGNLCGGIAQTLPTPMMNILNGGAHADNGLAFQEFMMVPAGARTFSDALRMGAEVFHRLKAILKKNGLTTAVGDEGGFAPAVASHRKALEWIVEAISAAGFQPGREIFLALDAAASEFYEAGAYHLEAEGKRLSSDALIDYYEALLDRFPILSIEDGLSENDWAGWKKLTERLGKRLQLVGDDLFVTDAAQIAKGVRDGVANAVLIKVNQIGTLTETLDAVRCAQQAGYGVIVSHRSGETEDVTLSDLAVGCGAGQIKCGSLSRTDRTAKYNQLLRIEETLGSAARFAGASVYARKNLANNRT